MTCAPSAFGVALFDYDGVITDSSRVRVEGFLEIFSDEPPEILRGIDEYTSRHGGESRFSKFQYIYDRILCRPLSPELLGELCARYAKLVVERAKAAPFIRGARELLADIHTTTDCYVISGVPQPELRSLVQLRGLYGMFRDVLGSPIHKATLTADVVSRYARRDNIVFIGDTITDLEAAQGAGIAFLGVASPDNAGGLPPDVEQTTDLMSYRNYFVP